MSLNHDVHNSPKEENYLNGSIDDFTDCIDFTKQYQKSCGYDEIIDDDDEDDDEDEINGINSSKGGCKKSVNSECNIDLDRKQDEDRSKETENKNEEYANGSESSVADSRKNDTENETHPMEPDVSITVKETNLENTINHVAKGVDDAKTEEEGESLDLVKPIESCKIKINKQKLVKKNHLKLPVNKNIKKKISLIKYKNGKLTKKKNESLQYQGIQSNVKFKCYKCSFSDFSSISELQTHQRKCITGTPDFQLMNESASSFSNSSSSSNFRITRKVYLCSACGSYYENWNLFLHMKEMHKRHICLYCLGMFSQPDKLAQHLQTKHSVVEQNLSSTEDFLKLYRGTCYLICVSCEAMFSEQEEFYEHSCVSSQADDSCNLCGLQGTHFPNCRRALSERHVEQPDSQKPHHPESGKKVNSKKKKVKGSKKSKEVFRIISNEQNGEMSVIVKKQNLNDIAEVAGDSRSMDSYFSVHKESGDKSEISPSRSSHEDLVSSKQYNEKMLQLYKPKLPEKVISSLQSIEDSINRVVENSRISDDDEKGNEEEEEYETNFGGPDEESSFCDKENSSSLDVSSIDHQDSKPEIASKIEESSTLNVLDHEEKSLNVEQEDPNRSVVSPNPSKKPENQVASDCESTDSEKLTIAFDQPIEHSSDKSDGGKKKEHPPDLVCDKPDDGVVTASRDTPYIYVTLKEDCSEVKALIKEFVKVSCWNCVYCSHAKRIAVNGKQIALHILAEHRFVTVSESCSDEEKEKSALSIIQRLKNSLSSLENCYFNTDTFDSEDKDFWKASDRIYECFHCLFATYVHKELYSHNRKMHQKAVFLCIMCKSNFYNYSELLCHLCPGIYIAGQVINPDITYRCFLCNVDPLPSSFRLMVHLRRKHNSCDICFDLSSNQFQLSTHVWKHKLSHMCYRCGIAYRNKPDITKHLFWKHGTESVLCKKCLQKKWPHVYHFCVPPNSFICDECSASLKSAVALKVHKRLHSGDYPYQCDKCEEKFISRKLLAKHLIKHEEEENRISKPETPKTPEVESVQNESQVDEGKSFEAEIKNSEESESKTEREKKPKKRKVLTDVFDLPPVNLSESDDSDTEDTELKPKVFKPEETSSPVEAEQLPNGYLNGDIQKEESSPSQIVDGVWNNFHNYLVAKDMPKTFRPGSPFKNMTLSRIKEIMLSDHDYHIIPNMPSQDPNAPKAEPEKSSENTKKVGLDHDYCNNVPKSKSCKTKQKTKHKEDASKSSSSDSSSDSDSSCSCGSNCSCSSGSSSSTSSNDSDSDYREKRKRKESPTEVQMVKEVEPEVPTEVDISVHDTATENLVRDSDLETDETETDEDFYDYNPAREANRILAEKRTQLLANLNGPDSAVSSPSYKPEKTASPKKKMKIKKRRSQFRLSSTSRTNRKKNTATAAASAAAATIPFNRTPVTPFVPDGNSDSNSKMSLDTPTGHLPYSRLRTEDSVQSSGEGDSKRPKRKRVPLKFYGFSSDDENESVPTSKKREKGEHSVSSTAASLATPPPSVGPSFAEATPHIWNPHSKGSLSWRIEKSESVTPKVNPIKIRTSHSMRQNAAVENSVVGSGELFQIKRPDRNLHMNGNAAAVIPAAVGGQKGEKLYCFCQCPYDEVSEMIACDAEDCVIEWFHFECVGIMVPPKGSWYCPDCRKKLAAENEFLSPPVNEQNAI